MSVPRAVYCHEVPAARSGRLGVTIEAVNTGHRTTISLELSNLFWPGLLVTVWPPRFAYCSQEVVSNECSLETPYQNAAAAAAGLSLQRIAQFFTLGREVWRWRGAGACRSAASRLLFRHRCEHAKYVGMRAAGV